MALFHINHLEKSFGINLLFSDVTFEVQPGEHIGLIGANGTGKTTLFKLLIGELDPDRGEIYQSKELYLGYMQQHVCNHLSICAYDEVLTVFQFLIEIEKKLEEIHIKIESKQGKIEQFLKEQMLLHDQFISLGGLTYQSRTKAVLLGLGFSEKEMNLPVEVLSGGQKAKLQLAKMLLCGANCMLLDEPTNHLDLQSIQWLESYLRDSKEAFIVVSHDRYFLDKVTNKTLELEHGKLMSYKGSYSHAMKQKEEDRIAQKRVYQNTVKEIKRIEGIVEQQRSFNRERNIRMAESKLKSIERLKRDLIEPERELETIRFGFQINKTSGNDVLSIKDMSLSFSGKQLFRNICLEIHRGEHVFLLGANGCGKTSLLKTILRQYHLDTGTIRVGAEVEIGYYDQTQESLDLSKTVLDEVWDRYPRFSETEIRSALAVFLFKGDDVFKPIAALSGGERAKVLLLNLMLSGANFLILDEPTNHLDIASCEALEAALSHYKGALLIVSHDRYFVNRLAHRIFYMQRDGIKVYQGNYDTFLEKQNREGTENVSLKVKQENDYKLRKERESILRKQKKKLERTEQEIEEIDRAIEELNQQFSLPGIASDYEKAMELTNQITALKNKQDALYDLWSELSEKSQ